MDPMVAISEMHELLKQLELSWTQEDHDVNGVDFKRHRLLHKLSVELSDLQSFFR